MWYVIHQDELYHHGILGQKWGKRNGPPYPLGAADHSASEKKAGWRKSLDKDRDDSYNKRRKTKAQHETTGRSGGSDAEKKNRGLTTGQKRAIAIGAAAVASGLAMYGGYKLYQSNDLNKLITVGKASFQRNKLIDYHDNPWDLLDRDDISFLNELQRSAIDINIKDRDTDGDWNLCVAAFSMMPPERQENCGACTLAGLSSFYGLKAEAKKDFLKPTFVRLNKDGTAMTTDIPGMTESIFQEIVPNAAKTRRGVLSADDIISYIKAQGDRSTGALFLNKGRFVGSKGHVVQWANISGIPIIIDNQIGCVGGVKTYLHTFDKKELLRGKQTLFEKLMGSLGFYEDCGIYTVTKDDVLHFNGAEDFIERRP